MKYLKLIFKNKATFIGVSIIISSCFFFLPTTLTLKRFLIPIKGEIQTSKTYLEDVFSKSRYGTETKSKRSSLEFKLNEYSYNFAIYKNLGDFSGSNHNTEFSKLNTYLKNSKSVVVWIKKSEQNEETPKIFQLDIDDRTEIKFQEVRSEYDFIILFTFILGSILFWIGTKVKHNQ